MKYYEIIFDINPCSQDAQDILAALAGEAGCETFEETPTGLKGYVQQTLYDEEAIRALVEEFPFDTVTIHYEVREAEDRDWNELWEQEGFEPICLPLPPSKGRGYLIIHDGRHLPQNNSLTAHQSPLTIEIEIDAHQAFGTGTHETTRMICCTLLEMDLKDKRVLDCGCGTGILGICALKLGAATCVGYDIDEWSTDNTRHNSVINRVDDRLQALCGDASLLDSFKERYDVVMANINRNILLQDMPRFRSVMNNGATLILSGFYQDDCSLLENKAQDLGLTLDSIRHDGDWACMVFHLK